MQPLSQLGIDLHQLRCSAFADRLSNYGEVARPSARPTDVGETQEMFCKTCSRICVLCAYVVDTVETAPGVARASLEHNISFESQARRQSDLRNSITFPSLRLFLRRTLSGMSQGAVSRARSQIPLTLFCAWRVRMASNGIRAFEELIEHGWVSEENCVHQPKKLQNLCFLRFKDFLHFWRQCSAGQHKRREHISQEIKGFRTSLATLFPSFGGISPEFNQARFHWVQFQAEFPHALLQLP
jgi:hypothetical protein